MNPSPIPLIETLKATIKQILKEQGLPDEWLDACIATWQKLIVHHRNHSFLIPAAIAPVLVRIEFEEQEASYPAIPSAHMKCDLKLYHAAIKFLDIPRNGHKTEPETFASRCKGITAPITQHPLEDAQILAIEDALHPFLRRRSPRMQIAILCHVTLQLSSPPASITLSFNHISRISGVPSPSLRSALEALAKNLRIEWRGVSTDFTGPVLQLVARNEANGKHHGKKGESVHYLVGTI